MTGDGLLKKTLAELIQDCLPDLDHSQGMKGVLEEEQKRFALERLDAALSAMPMDTIKGELERLGEQGLESFPWPVVKHLMRKGKPDKSLRNFLMWLEFREVVAEGETSESAYRKLTDRHGLGLDDQGKPQTARKAVKAGKKVKDVPGFLKSLEAFVGNHESFLEELAEGFHDDDEDCHVERPSRSRRKPG